MSLDFQRIYDGSLKHKTEEKEIEIHIDDTEELDPIIDGVIDIGSAVSEELGLEIDPFPRADGTDYTDFGVGPEITEEEVQSSTPFAALAELKINYDEKVTIGLPYVTHRLNNRSLNFGLIKRVQNHGCS